MQNNFGKEYEKLLKELQTYIKIQSSNISFLTDMNIDDQSNKHINPQENIDTSFSDIEVIAPTKKENTNQKELIPIEKMELLQKEWGNCKRCKLADTRNKIVFGEGSVPADIMFIGEGPGANEDRTGQPFVGRAGELLTKMINAMGLTRQDIYIGNIVKCRPPQNRNPEPSEIISCIPVLYEQIKIVNPKIIVALGRVAAQTLLSEHKSLTSLRGKWLEWKEGISVLATYHPAYLLRNPAKKREAWIDLQMIMSKLNLKIKK